MSHMVIYRTADGQPGYHQTDQLDDAVQFVERLRNTEGVDQARIFHMEEVTFDFRPYFRVEVGNETSHANVAPAPAPAPAASPLMASPEVVAPAPAAMVPAPLDERSWMDMPVMEEPAEPPLMAEPLLISEPSPFAEHEVADPIFETLPPPPPPPPAVENDDAAGSGNGMGARRGLFGR